MGMYWLGLATPFLVAVMAGVAWLMLQACHALMNRLMRWAHGRLVPRHRLPLGYDDSHGWTAAEHRFTEALIRNGGRFRSFPFLGWQVCIVPDRPAPAGTHGQADTETAEGASHDTGCDEDHAGHGRPLHGLP